jgi:2-polyprenyl-6-methoxyphenol hydroxylase-like FAD-dependent oxidoreductase
MRVQRLPSPALGLSRHALDARLAHAFTAAGGILHAGVRVAPAGPREGRVVATGRRAAPSPWFGLKAHVRGIELSGDLEFHLGDSAYVGLSGVEDGWVNLCGLFRRRRPGGQAGQRPPTLACDDGLELLCLRLSEAGLGALAGRVSAASFRAGSLCAVAGLAVGWSPPARGQIRIGDSLAMTPPFTGNGMAMAFQSAEAALEELLSYARGEIGWPGAVERVNRALRRKFALRLASAGVINRWLLHPRRQRWAAALNSARLLPLGPLYSFTH